MQNSLQNMSCLLHLNNFQNKKTKQYIYIFIFLGEGGWGVGIVYTKTLSQTPF